MTTTARHTEDVVVKDPVKRQYFVTLENSKTFGIQGVDKGLQN